MLIPTVVFPWHNGEGARYGVIGGGGVAPLGDMQYAVKLYLTQFSDGFSLLVKHWATMLGQADEFIV